MNNSSGRPRIRPWEWAAAAAGAAVLFALAFAGRLRWDEVFGFLSGGICVWLVVRQHVWNWPVGLVNNVVFFVLFFGARLYADMGLQVVFFALGVYGWWNWVRRGPDAAPLRPTHAPRGEWLGVAVFLIVGAVGLRELLIALDGAAPFWDAVTSVLSIAAQYVLGRKRVENWYLWIVADFIYVPLYVSRELPLTAVLYGVFLAMCVAGHAAWRRAMRGATV